MYKKNFIDACMSGEAFLDDIDDYVDYWHENNTGGSLQDFLGMTESEYAAWCERDDNVLHDILRCRVDAVS
ncbi:MAG: hypothetical protein LBC28_04160 [Oscillospiraceae bacterium]|jgi:hypothetical protein|nr:hypothetical protein [Oscillospiraceae bacterium]